MLLQGHCIAAGRGGFRFSTERSPGQEIGKRPSHQRAALPWAKQLIEGNRHKKLNKMLVQVGVPLFHKRRRKMSYQTRESCDGLDRIKSGGPPERGTVGGLQQTSRPSL